MLINTFISDTNEVPAYTEISLRQARKLNPEMSIHFICKHKPSYFDELNIEWVNQDDVKGELIDRFNELSWFNRHGTPPTSYPSPEGFWHKTCERIFYLATYAQDNKLQRFIHTENDVLMFYDYETFKQHIKNEFYATIMSEKQATFAIVNIPLYSHLLNLCHFFLHMLQHGEQELTKHFNEHVSEMTLLRAAMSEGIIDTFNIMPKAYLPFIFDPGSYGQFLGGTNNFHDPGFKDLKHYPWMFNCDAQIINHKPVVIKNDIQVPLFNLHVHSKNLGKFI